MVIGDAPKVGQVLTNLISNSLRYGKEGGKTQVRFYDMEERCWWRSRTMASA